MTQLEVQSPSISTMTQLEVQSPYISILNVGASVPIGTIGKVWTTGRNDMSTSQVVMFYWAVRDPDGLLVLEDDDKTLFGVSPGDTEKRGTPSFNIDKPGTWTILIQFLMNPDDPVVVDSYEGDLCVVTEEFAGTITEKELQYDSVRSPIPVY